eukprot:2999110-Pleurochrysis_carterae.AAC.1
MESPRNTMQVHRRNENRQKVGQTGSKEASEAAQWRRCKRGWRKERKRGGKAMKRRTKGSDEGEAPRTGGARGKEAAQQAGRPCLHHHDVPHARLAAGEHARPVRHAARSLRVHVIAEGRLVHSERVALDRHAHLPRAENQQIFSRSSHVDGKEARCCFGGANLALTTTSMGPYFSKDGVLHVICVGLTNLPPTVASRFPSENLTCHAILTERRNKLMSPGCEYSYYRRAGATTRKIRTWAQLTGKNALSVSCALQSCGRAAAHAGT